MCSNLKELHPIQIAKYALAQGIEHEPAIKWWVHHVFKERDQIIFMLRKHSTWYLKKTHKFGIELPKMLNEAYANDEKNENALWQYAIQKELENVNIAFWIIPNGKKPPNGFHYVNCPMMIAGGKWP